LCNTFLLMIIFIYSLRPEILVQIMDVSRCILVLDTPICIHFYDKYFRTEEVQMYSSNIILADMIRDLDSRCTYKEKKRKEKKRNN